VRDQIARQGNAMIVCDAHDVAVLWAASIAAWRLGGSGYSGDSNGDSSSSGKCDTRVTLLRWGGVMGVCDGDKARAHGADNAGAGATAE